jgi:hypothetical protein
MRVVIITTAVAFAILVGILLFDMLGAPSVGSEYLKFGLALVMFLVILAGSYGFVYWVGGRREE